MSFESTAIRSGRALHKRAGLYGRHRLASRLCIGLAVLVTVYPILFVMLTSIKKNKEFYVNIWGLPKAPAFDNYPKALVAGHLGEYFINSLVIVGTTLVLTLLLGALAGYALSKLRVPHPERILAAVLLCTMLPSESVLMPSYLITSRMGITGTHLALILPYIGWGLPMTIYIYRNFFNTLSSEIMEAARMDGCSEFGTFLRIAAPLMLPATATNAIFIFCGWWGELLWSSVQLAATNMKTLPIGMIACTSQFGTDWGTLSAAVCMVILPLVAFFVATQRFFIQGLTSGAVKG